MPKGIYQRTEKQLRQLKKQGFQKGCSKPLNSNKFQRGHKFWDNPESKKHLFKKEHPQFNTGRTRFKKGCKFSIKHRKKISEALKGKNGPNWQGGITPKNTKIRNSIEFRLWREAIFTYNNYTCQKCKIKGIYLHSHHIQNFSQYPELRFAADNGITLCENCHKEFHKKYGREDNTKQQLEEFMQGGQLLIGSDRYEPLSFIAG